MTVADKGEVVAALTISEVADSLRCSENHVRRLIGSGALRATDIGQPGSTTKLRVRAEDLAAFLDSRAGS